MIEIKTQAQFDSINATITATPVNGELIRIYALDGGLAYQTSSPISITRSNVIIEGINKPVIQSNIVATTDTSGSIILCQGASGSELENITLRGLTLLGNKVNSKGTSGVYCTYVGKSFTTGLTSGTYSRYNSATNGVSYINKKGITIKDCIIKNNRASGIFFNTSSNSNLIDNTISYNNYIGIVLDVGSSCNMIVGSVIQGNSDSGISIQNSSYNSIISNNTIQNNINYGILINGGGYHSIMGNVSQNNSSYGLILNYSYNNSVSGNSSQNNGSTGIYLSNSHYNSINANIVQNNGDNAIGCISSNNNSIIGNTLMYNFREGLFVMTSNYNTIVSNNITYNLYRGITINDGASKKNMIYSNVILNNSDIQVADSGTGDIYSTSYNV